MRAASGGSVSTKAGGVEYLATHVRGLVFGHVRRQHLVGELQAALDGAAESQGKAKMKLGEDGSPGFFEEAPPPGLSDALLERGMPGYVKWLWVALILTDLFLCGMGVFLAFTLP
mgnify:CR=1 FL=1